MIPFLAGLVAWALLLVALLGVARLFVWSAREVAANPWLAVGVVAGVLAVPVAVQVARRVRRALTPRAAIRYDPPREPGETP
jgi:hypothetical protein